MFYWNYSLEGDTIVRSAVNAEVDRRQGDVKSLYYGDIAFWNRKPPIDVPIFFQPRRRRPERLRTAHQTRRASKESQRPFKLAAEKKPR